MCSRTIGSLSLAVALLLAVGGCDFEHPAGAETGQHIDQRWVGTWIQTNAKPDQKPLQLVITPIYPSHAHISFAGLSFAAHHIDLPGVVQAQLTSKEPPKKGARVYVAAVVGLRNDRLHVRRITVPKDIALQSPGAVRTFVQLAVRGRAGVNYVFARADAAAAAPPREQSAPPQRAAAPQAEAIARLRADCARDVAMSCYLLGERYRRGEGLSRDPRRAVTLLEKACDAGVHLSCSRLGLMHTRGDGIRRDAKRAIGHFERACEGGHMPGCWMLGTHYRGGDGVSRDLPRATALFGKACSGGSGGGCAALADLYQTGMGVPQNRARASALYRKACSLGSKRGCERIKAM